MMSCYVVSYRITLCHVAWIYSTSLWCCITLYIMLYHVISCCFYGALCQLMLVLFCDISCCVTISCHVIAYRYDVMSCAVMSCNILWCLVMRCDIMSCHILYYIILYYVMSCYVILYYRACYYIDNTCIHYCVSLAIQCPRQCLMVCLHPPCLNECKDTVKRWNRASGAVSVVRRSSRNGSGNHCALYTGHSHEAIRRKPFLYMHVHGKKMSLSET